MTSTAWSSTVPSRGRGRPVAGSGDVTRQRVLLAARDVFASRGYAGASMRVIAAEAGVTAMALYHYAPSKAALFELVWKESVEALYAGFDVATAGHDSLADEVDAVLDLVLVALHADPHGAQFTARFLVERRQPDLAHLDLHTAPYTDFFGAITQRAVARGELAPDDLGTFVALVTTLLWGFISIAAIDLDALQISVSASKAAVRRMLEAGIPVTGTR